MADDILREAYAPFLAHKAHVPRPLPTRDSWQGLTTVSKSYE